jgi:pyruvate ferredoxin oxidoreductase beta subunit
MTSLYPVYVPKLLSRDEHFVSGRRSCKGCGKALSVRMISKMMGKDAVAAAPAADRVQAAGCVPAGMGAPWDALTSGGQAITCAERLKSEEGQSPVAPGARRKISKAVIGLDMRVFSKDPLMLDRVVKGNRDVLYICYDSEMYMDALIKKTTPTLYGHESLHLPGRQELSSFIKGKNIPLSILESSLSYVATACPSYPLDLLGKIRKGLRARGTSFISVLTPCPTGWLFNPELTARFGVMAVESGFYPLMERESGSAARITEPVARLRPLADYFNAQHRYVAFPRQLIALLGEIVSEEYAGLAGRTRGKDA